jgi:hypothetical protein
MKLIKELNESTPFKRLGNHKGVLTRTLSPAEQRKAEASLKTKTPAEQKLTLKEKLSQIYQWIDYAISVSIPDGDPGDYLYKRVGYYLGIPSYDVKPWLDRAVKENAHDVKTFDEYVAMNWDSYWESQSENDEEYQEKIKRNPWR